MYKMFWFFLSVLFIHNAIADDVFDTNVANGCNTELLGVAQDVPIEPVFTPKIFQCATGQYLPVNTANCEPCPAESTCTPGAYAFNENKSMGIVYDDTFIQSKPKGCAQNILGVSNEVSMEPVFRASTIQCAPGYYLIENNVHCVPCPADSYCPGGTYTFNETMAQGINPCANGLHTPAGMWESDQCGRILHIGENVIYMRSTRKTIPSFNIRVGNDIFYGNMTTADVPMSATATQKLKVKLGDTIYSVYDDTVNVGE